jgi:serine/threonine protein kinase
MRAVTELTPEAWWRIGTVLDRVSDADSRTWNEALAHACEAEGVRVADVEPFLTALRRSGRFLEHLDPGILEECVRALAADDRPALAPGARLGAYEVIEALGAGGMGEVYKARDTRLSRLVAIKLVRVQIGQLAEARQRFEREARAISALNHPHICTLYDVGEHDSREFLVMELIEGETLAARLERGPLSIEETLRYGIQIADALASAHRQGIVHRDLKPSNVMLTPRGAKLLDFGLATLRAPQALSGAPDPTVTAEGAVLGTVLYMAPEQLEGKSVDARADLFALGAILFEMLTGRRAYDADTTSIIKERLDAPPAFDWAIRQCLVKTADQRWQNAADLASCLQWIAASPGTTDERPKTSSRRRMLIPFAVTIVAVLLASILFATRSRKTPVGEPFRYDIPPPEGTTYGNMFALSPDGRRIAFVAAAADATGGRALWIRPLDALISQRIAGTENALYPFWSPDGTRIGFFADNKLKKVELATGNVQIICEAGLGGGGHG